MARRLSIAFFLIALVSLACWYVLPKAGVDLPWFVPMLGYAVILFGTAIPMVEEWLQKAREPKKRSIDEVDPGPGEEDLKRFGDPWLKITEGDDEAR